MSLSKARETTTTFALSILLRWKNKPTKHFSFFARTLESVWSLRCLSGRLNWFCQTQLNSRPKIFGDFLTSAGTSEWRHKVCLVYEHDWYWSSKWVLKKWSTKTWQGWLKVNFRRSSTSCNSVIKSLSTTQIYHIHLNLMLKPWVLVTT